MSFKPFVINDGIVTDGVQGGSIHVEPGIYLVEIDGASPSPEDQDEDKNAYINWHLKIIDGPDGIGRRIRHMTVMSDKTMFHLGNLIHYSGQKVLADSLRKKRLAVNTRKEFEAFVSAMAKVLTGKRLGAVVADDSYQGTPSSKVAEFFFASDYEASPRDVAEVEDDVEEPELDVDEILEEDEEEEEAPSPPKKTAAKPSASKPAAKAQAKKPAAKSLEDELADYFK